MWGWEYRTRGDEKEILNHDGMLNLDFLPFRYIRLHMSDGLGIIKAIGEEAEKAGVSIFSIHQNPITDKDNVYTAVTTEESRRSQVGSSCLTSRCHSTLSAGRGVSYHGPRSETSLMCSCSFVVL